MLNMETELEGQFQELGGQSIPTEIVDRIRELQRLIEDITFHQASATFAMTQDRLAVAQALQGLVTDGFERAEKLLDRIRREVAAALDEFDLPNPSIADLIDPTLDEFLAQLEREPNIEAQLGLPNRPRNLRVIADSLAWQQNGYGGLGDSEEAARRRSREAMQKPKAAGPPKKPDDELTEEERQQRDAERKLEDDLMRTLAALKQKADDPQTDPSERRRLAQRAAELERMLDPENRTPEAAELWTRIAASQETQAWLEALAQGEALPDDQWNKLLSTLDDGLWQVGGRTPPEDYRKAIERYQDRLRRLTGDER
jgi:hypothetical protein